MQTSAVQTGQVAGARGSRGWRRRARTIVLWTAAAAVALAGALLAAGAVAKASLRAQHPPAGQLVDVGGFRMHLSCQGAGGPTVVIEAGGGEFGLHWALVQPEVARETRVCVYDRAGLGWSEPSPRPRTAAVMADELHTLLERAGVGGPYVLVGHSLGGLVVRQFAAAHPDEVVGVVLVDSSSEQQQERFPAAVREAASGATSMFRLLGLAGDAGLLALFPGVIPSYPQLPADATIRALVASSGKVAKTFLSEMLDVTADPTPRPDSLGNIPLVVLRHGRSDLQPRDAVTPEVIQEYEATWAQMQDELAALSPRGRVVVAEGSGHGIHLERPDLVVAAVREVLAAAR